MYAGLIAVVAAAAGAGLAAGGLTAAAVVFLTAAPLLLLLAERLGYRMLVVWIALEGLATPFLRYPSTHTLVTFDRLWIPLAAVAVLGQTYKPLHTSTTRRLALVFWAFVAWIGLRVLFTSPTASQRYALGLWVDGVVLPAIVYVVIRASRVTENRVRLFAAAFAVGGSVTAIITILEKIAGFELATRSGGAVFTDPAVGIRYSGPYSQPDMLAVALLICLAMTLLWLQLRRSLHPLGLLAIGLELAGIFLTYFRGAWIAALVVVIVSLGLRPRRYARLVGFTGLAAVIGVVAFLQLGDTQSSLSARVGNTQNVVGRIATYKAGFQLFTQHPLVGVGVSKYALVASSSAGEVVNGVASTTTAHNSYLDVLVEDGLIGFVLMALLSVAVWRLIHDFRKVGQSRTDVLLGSCLAAAVLAYLILALEESVVLQGPPDLLLAACIGLGAARLDALARPWRS